MSALIKNIGLSDDKTSVTKISANARIDYILRFSKQAIIVVDESTEQNGQITNQFIATIPEQHNAAYISLSAQFNDIQIRCRIIEQLSAGELFDPEISLAVSVINLARKSQQAITLVLDNSQHLSLQILHEVVQLAAIAKKANLVINIVMFGSPQTGIKVQENKSLFQNKLTLLSAQSGQLLPINSAIFNAPKPKWYALKINKWLASFVIALVLVAASIIILLQQNSFNFAQPLNAESNSSVELNTVLTEPQPTVLISEPKPTVQIAKANDIFLSLTEPEKFKEQVIEEEIMPATANDIMLAMTSISVEEDDGEVNAIEALDANVDKPLAAKVATQQATEVNNNYYLNNIDGYVIQIAAFRELNLPAEFLASLDGVDFHIYQRLLNNAPVYVITSPVFSDKLLAQQELSAMPATIQARQPWIKSIKVINNEINAFLSSQ